MQTLNTRPPEGDGRTVIVLGCGRGGTSALAGALRVIGIPLQDNSHPLKHESSPIVYAVDQVDRPASEANLRAMDRRFRLWGWKSPRDLYSVHSWVSMVRNPMFVLVWRDQLETVRSVVAREDIAFEVALRHVVEVYAELGRFAFTTPFPLAIVDYGALCVTSRPVLLELATWLGCAPAKAGLARAEQFLRAGRGRYTAVDNTRPVFAIEEIAADQRATHAALYGQALRDLGTATRILERDICTAEAIIKNLGGGEFEDSATIDAALTEQDGLERGNSPAAGYWLARDIFIKRNLCRNALQRRIDALVLRNGTVASRAGH